LSGLIKIIEDNFEQVISVISGSFMTVAKDFNLTKESVPTNPAFIELDAIIKMREKGIEMYGIYLADKCVGFVAIEKANEEVYRLEKLAVLPGYRHHGYGKELIDFVFNRVSDLGGKVVSIAIINDSVILKQWYIENGFIESGRKVFEHLPFEVCFMEKKI